MSSELPAYSEAKAKKATTDFHSFDIVARLVEMTKKDVDVLAAHDIEVVSILDRGSTKKNKQWKSLTLYPIYVNIDKATYYMIHVLETMEPGDWVGLNISEKTFLGNKSRMYEAAYKLARESENNVMCVTRVTIGKSKHRDGYYMVPTSFAEIEDTDAVDKVLKVYMKKMKSITGPLGQYLGKLIDKRNETFDLKAEAEKYKKDSEDIQAGARDLSDSDDEN